MTEPMRRRRRVRSPAEPQPTPPPPTREAGPVTGGANEPSPWVAEPADADAPTERSLRGLLGGGSSQVSPTAAMRARDASRPLPEDLARAEAELAIVRRHWVPRD